MGAFLAGWEGQQGLPEEGRRSGEWLLGLWRPPPSLLCHGLASGVTSLSLRFPICKTKVINGDIGLQ